LLADSSGGTHVLTVDDHDLLDDATGLTELVAEAADDPHLLRFVLGNDCVGCQGTA